MLRKETTTFDVKSLRTVKGKKKDFDELAKDCVAFANARGGNIHIGIEDGCSLPPDQLLRLLNDKPSYSWETKVTKVKRSDFDDSKYKNFLTNIRESKRVSQFVKDKTDDELLDYYMFTEGDYLTNLGVLWIGKRNIKI